MYCNGNPVGFVDPSGESKVGDKKLNKAKQQIINGNKMDGNGGLSEAWKKASPEDRKIIEETADFIRNFSTSKINKLFVLVNKDAAKSFGHTEVLFINEKNQAVLFGYFSKDGEAFGEGETRISVYNNSAEWGNLLDSKFVKVVTNNGNIVDEKFTEGFSVEVDCMQGGNAFNKMASMFANPGEYNLVTNNCDTHTKEIFEAAGLFYDYKKISPNESYNNTKIYYRDRNEWLRIQWYQMLTGR